VAVLGCAVNGIGEASHADFGITGAKNEGLIFAQGKPLRKVPQERLVDELFVEIDRSLERGRTEFEAGKSAEGAAWLQKIEEENADDLTPERLAALEAEAVRRENENGSGDGDGAVELPQVKKVKLDEAASPTEGRRFTRA
jgi:(E)-4-hydroxy-3-methylbut-2-enyl-diphosphate synthase